MGLCESNCSMMEWMCQFADGDRPFEPSQSIRKREVPFGVPEGTRLHFCILISVHILTGCVHQSKDSPTAYKTVHWTVLYPPFGRAGLSSPLSASKNGKYQMVLPVFWYTGRDSNPQPSEPESDALSIEPPVHLLKA